MTAFSQLGLHPRLLKALEQLDFNETTEVQAQAIPPALSGKDLIVSAKTGSGKTAAFSLPILQHLLENTDSNPGTRALILLPTRELAIQTQKMFAKLAAFTQIKTGLIIGGEATKHQVASIRKNPEVFIATPGRLQEHVEKGNMDFSTLEFLVLDEADRMLDMGFAEAMQAIADSCNPARKSFLFSATLNHKDMAAIQKTLKQPETIKVDSHKGEHEFIRQQAVLSDNDHHKEQLVRALIKEENAERILVFCKTRAQSQKLSNLLRAQKFRADFIHGEISQNERKQVMNRFRNGTLQVLVATDVAARGLDVEDVDLVINFTMAHSGDEHVHRVGRTGRAGQHGLAISLVDSSEWNLMASIERYLQISFERRKVKDLEGNYKGPKKIKKSGKAAGSKKKKTAGKNSSTGKRKDSQKPNPWKQRASGNKKVATKKAASPKVVLGEGFGTIKKKKDKDPE